MTIVFILIGLFVLGQIIYSVKNNQQQSWNCKLFVLFGGVDHDDDEGITPIVEGLRGTIPPAYVCLAYFVYLEADGNRARYIDKMALIYQRGRQWAREKGCTPDNQHWSNVFHSAFPDSRRHVA